MRYLFIMLISVITAQWIYAELQLLIPGSEKYINVALEKVRIPTHDKWDLQTLSHSFNAIKEKLAEEHKTMLADKSVLNKQEKDENPDKSELNRLYERLIDKQDDGLSIL